MPCRAHPVQPMRSAKDIQCALFCSCFRTKGPRRVTYCTVPLAGALATVPEVVTRRYKTVARDLSSCERSTRDNYEAACTALLIGLRPPAYSTLVWCSHLCRCQVLVH